MSRQQLLNMYQRQIALGGMASGGHMGMEGGNFSDASRAGLAEYQAWRRAYALEYPGASRDALKAAWRMHKASMGEPAPGSRKSKPSKGLRHCSEFKEVATKKGPARRCAKWAMGPKGSALVGGYSDMTPMKGMALVGGARMSKGVAHCMEEALGPSGLRRCKKFMAGPRSAAHSGSALVGGFPGQKKLFKAWEMENKCDLAGIRAARARARSAFDASTAEGKDFRAGVQAAMSSLGLPPGALNLAKLRAPRRRRGAPAAAAPMLEQKAEQAHQAAAQLEVAAERADAQGAPAAAAELQMAAQAAEAQAENLDAEVEALLGQL